ncbi:MAG TPA: DEAD/DEAH box helicase family protein [Longimicrobiales bacterium]
MHFLLADDAGAGKTVMAGFLIRELELRGLAERVLIAVPRTHLPVATRAQGEVRREVHRDEWAGHS